MTRALAAALLFAASAAAAGAQVTGPLPNPPPYGSTATANLLFESMLAVSRAAQRDPQNAQAAALNYQQAVQQYRSGNIEGARASALQALMNANRPVPQPLATIAAPAPTSYGALGPLTAVNGGNLAAIDTAAFVAQARGAVAACVTAADPHAVRAQSALAQAVEAQRANRYEQARSAAKTAVDLCAPARR